MVDLVAVVVVQIENVFSVGRPEIPVNRAMGFVRDRMWLRTVWLHSPKH